MVSGRTSLASPPMIPAIEVGPEALISGTDKDNRLFVLSQGADKNSGAMRILSGTKVVAEYKIAAAPKFARLSDDGKRAYVCSLQGRFYAFDLKTGDNLPGSPLGVTLESTAARALGAASASSGGSGRCIARSTASHSADGLLVANDCSAISARPAVKLLRGRDSRCRGVPSSTARPSSSSRYPGSLTSLGLRVVEAAIAAAGAS